ncbi:HEPN domain-containing protein [Methanoplanus limicola]|uniref:HEPN domain protein n=1 Tax=Methanoplanus limicola DSM 2279 TaxID=937775 RepID=H1YY57_9EURY|nr:HEPN domain-containing protein [Methanoplanus limicola]EHQ36992.1 HEPN domain protein [Methanoplanus limicola DSM 2279]
MNNPEINALIKKSKERLKAAESLLNENYSEDSVNRSYYAMYLASTALLLLKGIKFKTHKGLISAIGNEFVKTGIMDKKYGRTLNIAEEARENADYASFIEIEISEAREILQNARLFVREAERIISESE